MKDHQKLEMTGISVKTSIINSLEYTRELCGMAGPEDWHNATLAAIAVIDSTIDVVRDMVEDN